MLLKSVLHDLQQPFLVAEVRCFAMLSKLVMAPLWNVLENKEVDMAQMNGIYGKMVSYFDKAATDPAMVMRGESPFDDEYLRQDAWWEEIFAPSQEFDGLTLTALAVILQALGLFAWKPFRDHLPGGVHANLDSSECKGVPKHNKLCERAFGLWDHMMRTRPNISSFASEAFCLFTMNKTAAWLSSMDDERRRQVTAEARKETPAMFAKFKLHQKALEEERAANLQHLKEEAQRREEKRMIELMSLIDKVGKVNSMIR
jgi:hypothetical protein